MRTRTIVRLLGDFVIQITRRTEDRPWKTAFECQNALPTFPQEVLFTPRSPKRTVFHALTRENLILISRNFSPVHFIFEFCVSKLARILSIVINAYDLIGEKIKNSLSII